MQGHDCRDRLICLDRPERDHVVAWKDHRHARRVLPQHSAELGVPQQSETHSHLGFPGDFEIVCSPSAASGPPLGRWTPDVNRSGPKSDPPHWILAAVGRHAVDLNPQSGFGQARSTSGYVSLGEHGRWGNSLELGLSGTMRSGASRDGVGSPYVVSAWRAETNLAFALPDRLAIESPESLASLGSS